MYENVMKYRKHQHEMAKTSASNAQSMGRSRAGSNAV